MHSNEIRKKYIEFFKKKGHKIIPSASLIPENDSSSLFITAGMQPLVPFLLGAKHQAGNRIISIQKCVRTGDIDEIGDSRHLTFFEMMGNWSLGDYFKKESIEWSLEFLTNKKEGLGLDPKRLFVTIFRGDENIPQDDESIKFWKENFLKHNIIAEVSEKDENIKNNIKIIPLKDDNFWIAGGTGPCGGDTEIFYDVFGKEKIEGNFQELVKSGKIIEIWNNVFMEFNKTSDGIYKKFSRPNVDTGMGLERTAVVMQGKNNVFETDIFEPLILEIRKLSNKKDGRTERIIADHIRSAVFIISDGVIPSNTEAGYVLRRILRRMIRFIDKLELPKNSIFDLAKIVINNFSDYYPNLKIKENEILEIIKNENKKFRQTLEKGLKEFEKGIDAFDLFQSYGFPIEMTIELAKEKGIKIDEKDFNEKMRKHQEISKAGSEQKFKGGLAGTSEMEIKYHTATHLLLASLRKILGKEIFQKGSNITTERIRFDFNWPEKLSVEKLQEVENLVNQKIAEKIPVEILELPKEEAKKIVTTISFDLSKYGDIVKVYKIGNFSTEFCGGPHIKNTKELGQFKIIKEESSSAGIRRIKAILI
ncbi:alanine--tRNA ligase [Candidatus Kuenenbacteria bacterium HGW-Kuenenbacteria-1]|uniref:alanine--tRNA ligase n=1 Tax=Candidatus Kuenenbacteria bacterium HGW-Kuenenbacteria-1 TaxID=2013812 RepID=A0A2N1UNC2_9BACT|nr:MAG: alanine--tRNA ligase [Candidatus Kuenenbacteria bacterium HGW-Kuenenbacteria-1]